MAGRSVAGWRNALPALVLVLVWILFCYRDTLEAMVAIWWRSQTFTHAFLVPPISLWLIWRQRRALGGLAPQPAPAALVLLLLAGFGWLLGELAAVNAVTQLALVAMVVLAVPALLGWRLALAMAFPLAYLFFAVPIGEFVMPVFMEWTADFTVAALRLTGIPVYREGLSFIIPSGSWSVVEACSGVRYLIASLVVGTLYAYLNYRSLRRRLIFVGVSLLVPIVANWLRAYMIVMLGHLSGNKLAVGVDHLIYGWAFFGVVILLMFWIGARWAEHPEPGEAVVADPMARAPVGGGRIWAAALATGLVALLPLGGLALVAGGDRTGTPALDLPAPAGWERLSGPTVDWRPAFDGAAVELQREYRRDGREVGVYIAYYRQQDFDRKLVSSINTLVRSEDKAWARVAGGFRPIELDGKPVQVATAVLRGPGDGRLVAWQWYWISGRLTSSQPMAKAYTALARLAGEGDDSAVVVLYAAQGAAGEGEAKLQDFVQGAGATIGAALRRARGEP